ncbi:hypothetical protein [Pseudotabrizicola sp. 4114]|uniref:hypothetical protein n=1 Tax=Pseudotabrizicola sp. 4114 TaxID=2817731 RepID=UPI00285B931C|nr:hypothetical protein [Pseudorhodobacter sp. 4114]
MPDPIQTLQTDIAKAQRAVDASQAKLARLHEDRRLAGLSLLDAQRRGDETAAKKAERLVTAATEAIGKQRLLRDRSGLAFTDLLKNPLLRQIDAPADVPLLLLPVRIETRFANNGKTLKVRIYPDDIHIDGLERGLTDPEAAAGTAYWTDLWAKANADVDAAFATLSESVGAARAPWVSLALRPLNWDSRATAASPDFPPVTAPLRQAALARLLPDYFHITAVQGSKTTTVVTGKVSAEVKIGLISQDDAALVEVNGLKVLAGTEWLHEYDTAKAMGLAAELTLPQAGKVDRLYVYGLTASRDPVQSATALADLLQAHACTKGFAFAPQGTPTNNTETDPAGWQRRIKPRALPLVSDALPADCNAAVLAEALGFEARDWMGSADHGQDREAGAAHAMMGAMWPATWGYFLETLDEGQDALSPVIVEQIRRFHRAHVRGRGPLPAIRIGNQPYGILPAMPHARFAPAKGDRFEAVISAFLNDIRRNWVNGHENLSHVGNPGSDGPIPEYMRAAAVSYGVRARKVLSGNMLNMIGATTANAPPPAANEALLTQLLIETDKNLRFAHSVGSLDDTANPVMLPYADPARDTAFLRALLDTGKGGPVSSLFQALASESWKRSTEAATVPDGTAGIIRDSAALSPTISEKLVGVLANADRFASRDYDDLIASLPGAGDPAARPAKQTLFVTETSTAQMMQSVTLATSVPERDFMTVLVVDSLLRGQSRKADLRAAFEALIELPEGALDRDFTLLTAEAIDTASHRLDAWLTGLASRRLASLRKARPDGLTLGAYGWVENLVPQQRKKPEGGYVAAPSLAQATTAGMLRSAYMNHNPVGGGDSAFAIDLSSRRVRDALYLLEGVRQGQPMTALLGYAFERQLHEAGCDRFILSFRGIAPLVQGALTDADDNTPQEAVQAIAAANVTDALALIKLWKTKGSGAIFDQLAARPDGNPYFDAGVTWDPPSTKERAAIAAAVDKIIADVDATADLMLAEAVHQMAQGNPKRASAAMDAAGRGEGPPPEPDVISTRTAPAIVTHRLISLLPDKGGWSTTAPRAQAQPLLEHWAGTRMGPPGNIILADAAQGARVTLAEAEISALDFIALSANQPALERLLQARIPALAGNVVLLTPGAGGLQPDQLCLAEAILVAQSLLAVLSVAKPADEMTFALPGTPGWRAADGAVTDGTQRLQAATGMLALRLQDLSDLLLQEAVDRNTLDTALMALAEFGLVLPPTGSASETDMAFLMLGEGQARLSRAEAALAAGPGAAYQLDEIAKTLFGREFLFPLPVVFDPSIPGAMQGRRAFAPPPEGALMQFLADWGSVRPAVASHGKALLLTGIAGNAAVPGLDQLCGLGQILADHWLGGPLPADTPSPTAPVATLILDGATGIDLDAPQIGLAIDEWTETLPYRERFGDAATAPVDSRTTAGVALHADAPNAQPPQVLLLAVAPDMTKRWTAETLIALFDDTLSLARTRMISLETLPLVGHILPAIYTQSMSLQGREAPDWSIIVRDLHAVALTPNLKNFAMVKDK